MGKQKWLLGFLAASFFSANAQQQKPATSINGKVSIPVIIRGSAIDALLKSSTPERQLINEKTETQDVDFAFNVSDGATQFNSSGIVHHMSLSEGAGMIKKRSCRTVWNSNLCSPWISMRFNEIRGKASFSIDAKLNADYSIATKGKLITEIENLEWAGMNITEIMKTFGWHYFEKDLNDLLAKECSQIDLKNKIYPLWVNLQQPILLKYNLALLIQPKQVLYNDLYFEKGVGKTKIGLLFSARIGEGTVAPASVTPVPLPNLTLNAGANDGKIECHIPLSLSYPAISQIAKDSLKGKIFSRKNKKGKAIQYLEITDIDVGHSRLPQYDIAIKVESNIQRTIFKKRRVPVYFYAKIMYDSATARFYVKKYKVDARTKNFLYNLSLETLANQVFYKKIKSYLEYNAGAAIAEQKKSVNDLLQKKINIAKGMQLSGKVQEVALRNLQFLPDQLYSELMWKGYAGIEVSELASNNEMFR
ncbi:MAG: DUF4403 family protein [Bacteroidetes bacterium]|nr:DUF4403 family protein [Bacteroidota bacterium]